MVGLGDVLLNLVHLLRVDVRVGVLGTVDDTGLQALVDLGEAHLARVGAHGLELLLKHLGRLYAELQATRILRLAQLLVGRQLLEAVVPVRQTGDVLVDHGGQQSLALVALLEAVDRSHVVEQERQVEYLKLLGVLLELGQRRRDQLDVAQQQRFHFLAVTEQRGVRVDLHLDLAGQTLLDQFLEHQCALALRRAVGDDVGELDDDRVCGLSQRGHA